MEDGIEYNRSWPENFALSILNVYGAQILAFVMNRRQD
jgi:hypothetical protein